MSSLIQLLRLIIKWQMMNNTILFKTTHPLQGRASSAISIAVSEPENFSVKNAMAAVTISTNHNVIRVACPEITFLMGNLAFRVANFIVAIVVFVLLFCENSDLGRKYILHLLPY